MLPVTSALTGTESEGRWSVLVTFDSAEARRRAMRVCENMVARFWPGIDFQIHWCTFDQLAEPQAASVAAEHACSAQMIIVAAEADPGLKRHVAEWMEGWSRQRRGREGALIGLIEGPRESDAYYLVQAQLRTAAHLAGLDYLTHEPECAPAPIPDDAKWLESRCGEMGSVLGDILQRSSRPVV